MYLAKSTAAAILFVCSMIGASAASAAQAGAAPVDTDAQRSSAAAMTGSIEKQKQSVRRQAGAADVSHSFFTVPWPSDRPLSPVAGTELAMDTDCEPLIPEQLETLVADAAARDGLEPRLLRAVIARESGGRPCAVSSKGAQGIMQLMPATQMDMQVDDPFNPAQNVAAGSRYLKRLLDRYSGDLSLALAAYNAGPARVDPTRRVPDIPEVKEYVAAVLSSLGDSSLSVNKP